ncbi:DUF3810 domain-containing protein [soil metagenome]
MNIDIKKRKALTWIVLIVIAVGIKIFSLSSHSIEEHYSNGIYQFTSRLQRQIFGWLPFSLGDIFYIFLACWLIYISIKHLLLLLKGKRSFLKFQRRLLRLALITLIFYIAANILWGLNYDRLPVATSMNLQPVQYEKSTLLQLHQVLLNKVNESKIALLSRSGQVLSGEDIYSRASNCYQQAAEAYPFLNYSTPSLKSSLFGKFGNYLGFTGYYNPLTGEAQVNRTVPKFLLPYITLHEMAHQLGFAKENEANFVAFLAAANSSDTAFRYSAYLDLFTYANRQLFLNDSSLARKEVKNLHPAVKKDLEEWREFNLAHKTFIEPAINWLYGKYLQANSQPQGMKTYGAVTGMLISYYQKYGRL